MFYYTSILVPPFRFFFFFFKFFNFKFFKFIYPIEFSSHCMLQVNVLILIVVLNKCFCYLLNSCEKFN